MALIMPIWIDESGCNPHTVLESLPIATIIYQRHVPMTVVLICCMATIILCLSRFTHYKTDWKGQNEQYTFQLEYTCGHTATFIVGTDS